MIVGNILKYERRPTFMIPVIMTIMLTNIGEQYENKALVINVTR